MATSSYCLNERMRRQMSFGRDLTYSPTTREHTYGAFKADDAFLVSNPDFNWPLHIENTFHDCMKPMIDKFTKVV